jgi:NAD-dependent dihydropyrimidine dehydrogenase PreA subunit
VIKIDVGRCNGCGACVEICPTGAIYLVDGRAAVEQELCRECEACVGACPTGAISLLTSPEETVELVRVPDPRPEPQVIQVKTGSVPASFRASVLPVVGGALAWAGRELVPRLAEYFLDDLDRRATERRLLATRKDTSDSGSPARGGGAGRRRRRRRRGG